MAHNTLYLWEYFQTITLTFENYSTYKMRLSTMYLTANFALFFTGAPISINFLNQPFPE